LLSSGGLLPSGSFGSRKLLRLLSGLLPGGRFLEAVVCLPAGANRVEEVLAAWHTPFFNRV